MNDLRTHNVEEFLYELRNSADIIYKVFTSGSCVRLYSIVKLLWPEAKAWWSDRDNHCVIEINDVFYDIGGTLDKSHILNRYFEIPESELPGYKLLKYVSNDNDVFNVNIERYKKQ